MYEEYERGSEILKERENELVPLRRYEAEKEAEQEVYEEPRLAEKCHDDGTSTERR